MSWTIRGTGDPETIREIDRQEDRGAAVIAGAYLEDFLFSAIKERFTDDAPVVNAFFSGMGPLATFNAKIEMAYLLRIVSKECRAKMHTIRRVRNEFAHNLQPLNFETPHIRDMCSSLVQTDVGEFITNEMGKIVGPEYVANVISILTISLPTESNGRTAYLNTIKIIAFCLATDLANQP